MITELEFGHARPQLDYFTGRLMADNRRHACQRAVGSEFPKIDMQVRTADAASRDFDQNLIRSRLRNGNVDNFDPGLRTGFRYCLHYGLPPEAINTTAAIGSSKRLSRFSPRRRNHRRVRVR